MSCWIKGSTERPRILNFLGPENSESCSETWLCGKRGSHVSWRKSRVWHTARTGLPRAFRWYQGQLGVNSTDSDFPMCHDGFWPRISWRISAWRSFNGNLISSSCERNNCYNNNTIYDSEQCSLLLALWRVFAHQPASRQGKVASRSASLTTKPGHQLVNVARAS